LQMTIGQGHKANGMLLAMSRRNNDLLVTGRHTLIVVLALFLLVNSGGAQASQGDKVYFAGVAFTGDAANVQQAHPHTAASLENGGNAALNQDIRRRLQSQALPIDVVFEALGSIKDSSNSVALALGIDGETTSVERVGEVYKTRVEITAQALFFDFKEKQVLGGFPFTIDYIDTSSSPPTDADIQKDFQGMLFGAPGQHSVAEEFATLLTHTRVPNPSNKHLRVTSVELAPKAIDYVNLAAPQLDVSVLPSQIADAFGEYLAANQQLSILPYSSNPAIGSSMAARFIEGEAYQLKIPEADYEIHLSVAGFKKVNQSQTAIDSLILYGAFVDVSVLEPLSGKVYFSQRIKQGESKTIPVTQTMLDDWPPAYDTLRNLFNNFTRSLSPGHYDWAKSGLPDDPKAREQLSSLMELIQSCR
jgi:hypothetical protein